MNANEFLPGEESANAHRRILVIDGDHDIRELSFYVLTGAGYYVEAVEDGVAGLKVIQVARYDLVVTDHKLLRMTGMEMIEKMRAAAVTIPVIIAARHLPTQEVARKAWLKPIVMLQRPFSNDDLLGAVEKVLRPAGRNVAATLFSAVKREPALEMAGCGIVES
jgi:DNA-binding NtrC family response regulator